jgi:glutamyl-tRNA reductase
MPVICLGLSYHTAPVELRECLNYAPAALAAALAARPADLDELVILSTCNRLELYAVVPDPETFSDSPVDSFAPLVQFLTATQPTPVAGLIDRFYRLAGDAAARHLCQVAAGLDSMILGEPQILGQVADAHALAAAHGAAT